MKVINFLKIRTIVYVSVLVGISACASRSDKKDEPKKEKPEFETLRDAPFPVGAALKHDLLKNNIVYRDLALKELSSITPENQMKMWVIGKSRGEYYWNDADFIVDFAQNNKIRLHGH